MLFIAEFCSFN